MAKSSKLSRNKRTEAQKRRIAEQRNRTEANRMRKMMYTVRMNPNDRQTLESMWRRFPQTRK